MASDYLYSKLPAPLFENYEWQQRGACNNQDPEMFFLPYAIRQEKKREYISKAKAVCATCTVVEDCLNYALDSEQEWGVWGGLSEEERQVVLRRRVRR